MPSPYDSRSNDNPSTYFVQDRKNKKEFTRLMMQDKKLTAAMGGILPEQPDPTVFHRVLDVGCGTGGCGSDLSNDVSCGYRHQPAYD